MLILKKNNEEIAKIFVENHQNKQEEEMKEWTFKPKLTKYNKIDVHSGADFYERVKIWNSEKDKKINNEREFQKEDLKKVCSFRPAVNETSRYIAEEGARRHDRQGSVAE